MRGRFVWISSGFSAACLLVGPTLGQPAQTAQTPPQINKEWTLGEQMAQDLDSRDGRIAGPAMTQYLQRIENQLALAAGQTALEIRMTRSAEPYATVVPNGVLYLSAGLAKQLDNEMELAGLLAHQLAHQQVAGPTPAFVVSIRVYIPPCVLSRFRIPGGDERWRNPEQQANAQALAYLKAAGYDPAGLLDLFSRLAHEHPAWARAIVSEDLLSRRNAIESEEPPPWGYRVNTNEFSELHDELLVVLGQAARKRPSLLSSEPVLPRR